MGEVYSHLDKPIIHFGLPPEENYHEEEEPEVYEYETHVSAAALRVALITDRILGVFRGRS